MSDIVGLALLVAGGFVVLKYGPDLIRLIDVRVADMMNAMTEGSGANISSKKESEISDADLQKLLEQLQGQGQGTGEEQATGETDRKQNEINKRIQMQANARGMAPEDIASRAGLNYTGGGGGGGAQASANGQDVNASIEEMFANNPAAQNSIFGGQFGAKVATVFDEDLVFSGM